MREHPKCQRGKHSGGDSNFNAAGQHFRHAGSKHFRGAKRECKCPVSRKSGGYLGTGYGNPYGAPSQSASSASVRPRLSNYPGAKST